MSVPAQRFPAAGPAARLIGAVGLAVALLATPAPVARAGAPAGTAPGVHTTTLPAGSRGVDVSGWQHPGGAAVDWNRVAASGVRFAVVKATELTATGLYTNPWF